MYIELWISLKSSTITPPTCSHNEFKPLSLKITSLGPPGQVVAPCGWDRSSEYSCIAAAAAKSLQSYPTRCDPIDGSPPGSPVPGILQARTLEWVAISSSNAWKGKVKGKSLSCVRLLATPWTAAQQAPPSMGVSRQEYWSGVPLPSLLHVKSLSLFFSLIDDSINCRQV